MYRVYGDGYVPLGASLSDVLCIYVFWDLIYSRNIHMPFYIAAYSVCVVIM